mmetsp:Transcript_24038/g.35265  ORF Transcript_24038/g.35265 Transcript_24038/m.35265 type:complete len:206 (-) Transcript_24038:2713-3330(-)
MHIPVRGKELSDLSATSGAIFLTSKLQEIVICRHQEIGDIAVYLGDGEGGRCPPPCRADDDRSDAIVKFFERNELASSNLLQMPFVKVAFNVRQDELSANEVVKRLVPIIEHPRDVLTRPPAINILSTQRRATSVILPNLLDRKRISFSIQPVLITTQSIHLFCRRPVTRIEVSGCLRVFGLEFIQSVRFERWLEGRANRLAGLG